MDLINLSTIFSVALLGSFGHCIGMCGGFVVAYSSSKIPKNSSILTQTFYHFIYNFGRITSYVAIGAICGFLGSVIAFSLHVKGFVFFAIGILMVLIGLSLFGKLGFLKTIESSISNKLFSKKIFNFLVNSKSFFTLYLLGIFNGFIPCGLVYFFAASAVASGSALFGALIMLIFGLFTLPAMVGFGMISSLLTQNSFRDIMMKIAAILVILYGIHTAFSGYMQVVGGAK
ncbi:MAG: sulfite exporter TauE/SafE family protein [Campylobacteraceae bacterium]